MKRSTLSKHPWRATCLFAMRSSTSLLSLKIFYWCFSFVNSKAFIWLSRPVMACWWPFFIFFCKLLSKMRKQRIVAVFSEVFWLCLLTWNTISYISSSLVQISYFWECFGQSTDFPLWWHYSFDTSGRSFLNYKRPLQYQGSFCYIQVPYTLAWRVSRVFYWRSQRIIPLH